MNLEEIYVTLRGASDGETISFPVILKWFKACKIIDGRVITDGLFSKSYERLCPNREGLSLVQFIQLVGILTRDSRQGVDAFCHLFRSVNDQVVEEIRRNSVQ